MIYAVFTWFVFVIVTAISAQVIRNREARLTNRRYVDVMEESFKSISTTLAEMRKLVEQIDQDARLSSPKEGMTRCYAVIVQRGLETRLFIQPSQTFEQMVAIVTREFGNGWAIVSSTHFDVATPKPPIDEAKGVKVPSVEPISKNENFIHTLEYSRDIFAVGDEQKKVIDDIISRIKKHHG